jgi:hypothetical protein
MLSGSSLPEMGSTNICLFFRPVVVHAAFMLFADQQRIYVVEREVDVVTDV